MIHHHFAMQGGELIGTGYAHSGMAHEAIQPLFWEIGIGAVEARVDVDTGEISIEKYVSVADVGKALNPPQCEGQDEGAVMMGFGHTFYESVVYEGGQIVNDSMLEYQVPNFKDVPQHFEAILDRDGNGRAPTAPKAWARAGSFPSRRRSRTRSRGATGARITELPLTPERVWRALSKVPR
jgi:CO/xanthine dehydrogenase Mo-binding subunit